MNTERDKKTLGYIAPTGEFYGGSAEFSEEDGVWHGKILGTKDLVTYESDKRGDLLEAFCVAVEDWLGIKEA